MKKRAKKASSLIAALAAAALLVTAAQSMAADPLKKDPCAATTSQSIEKHMPIKGYTIVSKTQVHPQICQVIISYEGGYVPIYAHSDFVLIGDYFSKGNHPTVQAIEAERTKDFKKDRETLERTVAFSYKPAKAAKYIYFITDPDCPACNTAKKSIKEFADENSVEIKVIFYPMEMHPKAKEKASAAICANFTYEDYLQDKYPPTHCKKGDEKIRKAMKIVEKIGIDGTPTFLSSTGQRLLGYDAEEIKGLL